MHRPAVAAAIMALAGAPAAIAQNALGDGRALDYNLQTGSGGVNSNVRNLDSVLRFQNAIVTGNAPGGYSFRGDVGYVAPGEFTGGLGTFGAGATAGLQIYDFRRDSVFSGIAGRGIRGTEALQYQFELFTGSNNTTNIRGPFALPRPNTGFDPSLSKPSVDRPNASIPRIPTDNPTPIHTLEPGDTGFDSRGDMLWNYRAPSSMVTSDALRPQLVDQRVDESGNKFNLTASALGGINLVPLKIEPQKADRAVDAPILAPQKPATQLPTPGEDVDVPDEITPGGIPGERTYEDIIKEIQGTPLPDMVETPEGAEPDTWENRILELRRMLGVGPDYTPLPPQGLDLNPPGNQTATPNAPLYDQTTIELLKQTAGNIDVLKPIGVGGFDMYTISMTRAEELLATGKYFDAEERFARAMAARPGDPMAAVGRVHAELGAGMYISAILNLRTLFTSHPELIGTIYAPKILPKPERLEDVKADLRQKLAEDAGLPKEASLLLAYIGYQTSDKAALNDGLDLADAAAPKTADARFGRLVTLLREVWTSKDPASSDD